MPRHKGIQRVEWDRCDRCNFEYPITMLIMQKGLKVCTKTCFDRTNIEERPAMIAAVLDDELETTDSEREKFIQDDGDLRFVW